eukprot:12589.XXX_488291_487774_1 [CDS] Oithona nana genome sequencing.
MKCIFLIFALVFIHTNAQGIPPELKCFMRGLTNRSCGAKIRQVCSEFKGDDKKPIPIPKSQFGGQCPILGQVIPLASSIAEANVDLPPCPCENGVGSTSDEFCFTCVARGGAQSAGLRGTVLKKPIVGTINFVCNANGEGISRKDSFCTF